MESQPPSGLRQSQISVIAIIIAFAAAGTAYRLLVFKHLEQTSALFIGIPSIIAILLTLTPRPKSVTGMICKVMAIALLMSAPLLGEGFICIIMAAPIFFAVGIVIGVITDRSRRSDHPGGGMATCLVLFGLMSLEGVTEKTSFTRDEIVSVSSRVPRSAQEVERSLASTPNFSAPLPLYLSLRFPRPTRASGEGIAVGDRRSIHFEGGEGGPGDLLVQVVERRPGYVRFRVISDSSKIAHWLAWQESEISWSPSGDASNVQVRLHYKRLLDPAWYFGPWERYAVHLSAEYLLQSVAMGSR
jgi:hypothetical protein